MVKKILGPLGPFLAKIDFGGQRGGVRSTVTSLTRVTVTRLRPYATGTFIQNQKLRDFIFQTPH